MNAHYRRSADIYRPYAALVDRKTRNHVENWISYDASRTRINLETYGIPSLEERPKDIAWIGNNWYTKKTFTVAISLDIALFKW